MRLKALLSNMGFVLQISGLFILLPIIISFIDNDMVATVALFASAIVFLALGFLLNALCERKELSYKQSCALIVLVFVSLSIIGAIPYIYINISQGDFISNLIDSLFESASGFTTTGFSVIPDLSILPRSIIFYRALTQLIGGIGIVLVLLAFFYPEAKLTEFFRSMGFSQKQKIKRTFLLILLIYVSYTFIMIFIGLLFGYHDVINLVSFIFSALSTGGFAPMNDISTTVTQFPMNYVLILGMILGACNFLVLAGLFKGKIKEFFKSGITVFFILLLAAALLVIFAFRLPVFDAIFIVVSGMSTTGFSYLSIAGFTDGLKLFLVFLMFVGGASFSTAGGIKIFRLLLLFKAIRKAINESISGKYSPITLFGKEYSNQEIIHALVFVVLMISFIFGSAFITSLYGFQPVDALFEATSAITCTGLSVGIVSPSLALELKCLFIVLMILGRVEILSLFIMFSPTKEPRNP
ncbi:MAG TPA: TrkH family potassium uptake protein [Thermoplasmata archaeon]|nr:TrkH family potassium uptake protein [Thermoplasmata archaeon]